MAKKQFNSLGFMLKKMAAVTVYLISELAESVQEALTEFGASGTNHSPGLVPDPGSTQGTTKFLREDGTWAVPAGGGSSSGFTIDTITAAAAMSIDADKVTIISGNVGTATITLQVPDDNYAHVWDFIFNTGSSVAVTFATSSGTPVWVYPENYALAKTTRYEINIIGVNGNYYIRYGVFG